MQILSSATYLPENHYNTENLASELPLHLSDDLLNSISNLNVNSRNFAYPISSIIDGSYLSQYPNRSSQLAEMAVQKLSFESSEVGFLIACCNAHDYICPNLSSLLLRKLGLGSETKHCTLQGFGCTSFIVALQLAQNYFAENSGKEVAIVTSEVNSMLFANDLRNIVVRNAELKPGTREWVTLIETMLFGDGAAATLISSRDGAV
jgi:3-oxoacyl-[acyl-carrier-protein] synthase III